MTEERVGRVSRPSDESARLSALRGLRLLDTAPEERCDRITRLAQRVFGVSMTFRGSTTTDDVLAWHRGSPVAGMTALRMTALESL